MVVGVRRRALRGRSAAPVPELCARAFHVGSGRADRGAISVALHYRRAVPTYVHLASIDDPRFEPFRGLRDRDARGRDGTFIVEGEVLLRLAAARDPSSIVAVVILDKRREKLEDALSALPSGTPVYLAAEPVMSAVVGFPIHRGILGLARRKELPSAASLLAAPGVSCVLAVAGVTNHDNVGSLFRNAAAFGVDAVLLDARTCDPLYRKALRVAVGAPLVVPFAYVADEGALVSELEAHGFVPYALTPRGALDLRDLPAARLPPKVALVCGPEGTGLAESTLARAVGLRITMAPGWDSLNVSVASGIALHALARPR